MSNLELRISNIVDAVDDELADLNPNELVTVWVSAKELIDESVQSRIFEAMKLDKELKPYLFCGGEAEIADDYSSELDKKRWMVWHLCEDGPEGQNTSYSKSAFLSIETPWFDSREEAVVAWNARVEYSK